MPGSRFVDLNADVGEGCGQDAQLMPLISSANIACGYHAGDRASMREAVALARDHGVAVGAHPSFPDRAHFGRQEMHLDPEQVHECIVAQVQSLADVAAAEGVRVRHVKPHGALYNMAARDQELAKAIAIAIASVDPALLLYGLAGSALIRAGRLAGLRAVNEVFADRAYRPDGSLVPRDESGAVLHDDSVVAARAVGMARDRRVEAIDGSFVVVEPDTICVHGDTPGAARLAAGIRDALAAADIRVSAPAFQT